MRDNKEQVNYDICKSAQQDEAFYVSEVKKDKTIPEGRGRGETRERRQA